MQCRERVGGGRNDASTDAEQESQANDNDDMIGYETTDRRPKRNCQAENSEPPLVADSNRLPHIACCAGESKKFGRCDPAGSDRAHMVPDGERRDLIRQ